MGIECWGDRGKKELTESPSVDHSRYDHLKQKIKKYFHTSHIRGTF